MPSIDAPDPIQPATTDTATRDAIQAATFRRLLQHLVQDRPDVQNIDLMIGAGFCRNCLADWYAEAAQAHGIEVDKPAARDAVYGGDFAQWKSLHQGPATPAQLAALESAMHAKPKRP